MGDTELQSNRNTLKVSEIFYSLQGEGGRAGEPSLFIRLSGCSAKHACFRGGVLCDTEFESGEQMTLTQIIGAGAIAIARTAPKIVPPLAGEVTDLWIVWTGGEPLDQLTAPVVRYFKELGYKQAIETSGIHHLDKDVADCLDWITVSPKVAEHILVKHFGHIRRPNTLGHVEELRYVRHAGQLGVPVPGLIAKHYYLSPHSDGNLINEENLEHCKNLCLENPKWKLSIQQHKLLGIL